MNKLSVSVIVTVLNEEKTLMSLLEALAAQTYPAQEVIFVDGGSTDGTAMLVSAFAQKNPKCVVHFWKKTGNRSVGRNEAISRAASEFIAITDAGCIPHTNWLEKLIEAYEEDVIVAGYYDAKPTTAFEEAVVPYVLVMPDQANPQDFLPATRSMLISKTRWQQAGKFDESLSDNEDYAFAHALKNQQVPIVFAKDAQVTWIPRSTLRQFAWMIFRFARGDAQARIWRPKVLALFARYLVAIFIFRFWLTAGWPVVPLLISTVLTAATYSVWAIKKNRRYTPRGWLWLPVLQFTADFAVMAGSAVGLFDIDHIKDSLHS